MTKQIPFLDVVGALITNLHKLGLIIGFNFVQNTDSTKENGRKTIVE